MNIAKKIVNSFLCKKIEENKNIIKIKVEHCFKKIKVRKRDIILSFVPFLGLSKELELSTNFFIDGKIENFKDIYNNEKLCNADFMVGLLYHTVSIFTLVVLIGKTFNAGFFLLCFFSLFLLYSKIIKIKRIKYTIKDDSFKDVIQHKFESDIKEVLLLETITKDDLRSLKKNMDHNFLAEQLVKNDFNITYDNVDNMDEEYRKYKNFKKEVQIAEFFY